MLHEATYRVHVEQSHSCIATVQTGMHAQLSLNPKPYTYQMAQNSVLLLVMHTLNPKIKALNRQTPKP